MRIGNVLRWINLGQILNLNETFHSGSLDWICIPITDSQCFCCCCTNNILSTMMEIAENRLYRGSSKSYALHFLIDSIRIRDLISCIPRTYVYTIIDNQFGPITNFSLDAEFLPTYLYYKISFSFFFPTINYAFSKILFVDLSQHNYYPSLVGIILNEFAVPIANHHNLIRSWKIGDWLTVTIIE